MKYYTMKVVTATDGTETRDLRGFDSYAEALVRFHSDLSSNINNCTKILELLVNSEGGIHKNEKWEAEVVTTEDTTEE